MVDGFDPGALLSGWYELPRGPRVCLRLARISDLAGIAELVSQAGAELDPLELVRRDPRRRVVLCAAALVDGAQRVVGVGAIDVSASEPDLLVVDEGITEGLTELLGGALAGRAEALRRARAA